MIRDRRAFERLRGRQDLEALRALTIDAAIELAEALLTSSVLEESERAPTPRARNLAHGLRIASARRP